LHNYKRKLCNFRITEHIKPLVRTMTDWYIDDEGNEQIDMLWEEHMPEEANEIDWDDPNDPYMLKAQAKFEKALKRQREEEEKEQAKAEKAKSNLSFNKDELEEYASFRSKGIALKSRDWIFRSAEALWTYTSGEISPKTLSALRDHVLEKYESADSHSKVLSFAKSFLKRIATTQEEPRYLSFLPYLEPPKAIKQRKRVTDRAIVEEDIRNILQFIKEAEREGKISAERSAQYSALILFGAYTGQRSESTCSKLTVGQFRKAVASDKPVLEVDWTQDKIRMKHYVPLHPCVVQTLKPLLEGRDDDELMFRHNSLVQWIKRHKIEMSLFKGHFAFGDLRKFAEQQGDRIEWDLSNRLYILTHGVSGVRDKHYLHPLPEYVFQIYMKYWKDVDLTI